MKNSKRFMSLSLSLSLLGCMSGMNVTATNDLSSILVNDLKLIDTKNYFDNLDDYTDFSNIRVYKYVNADYNKNMHSMIEQNTEDVYSSDYEFKLYLYAYEDAPELINQVFIEFLVYDLPADEDYNKMLSFLEANYPDFKLKKLDETDDQCKQYPSRIGKYQVVTDENKTEEEMFEIANNIENALGYRFLSSWNQSTGSMKIDFTGDVNTDGEVSISDVLAITAYVGNSEKNQLSETGLTNADVNGDGVINANDALTIQQYLAGIITEF